MLTVWSFGGYAYAQSADAKTATGAEGADVSQVVVTAERSAAAAAAPSKASLAETQPQSIITHRYLEQSTPESGDYTTAVVIAPSVSGVSSNGGGVGDTNTSQMRGFQDGQYNVTYDGIAFGDANDTTHHPAAFFPGSIIGAVVVDRGPGAAGDLGQANFGGAFHLFSPTVSDVFGVSQKATYGSFNTQSYVTTVQTGAISQLNGAKLLLNFDERSSDGELSYMKGVAYNQTAKLVVPVTDTLVLTGFTSFNYTKYYQTDNGAGLGAGVTPAQLAAYGKNFQLDNNPFDEHYFGYNYVVKHTDFNYVDLRWDATRNLTVEDQAYYYYYSNHTVSAQAASDLVNPTFAPAVSPSSAPAPPLPQTDIGGYRKLNQYQTYGDILRVNQNFGFGTLRAGGLLEWSQAQRFIKNYDLTTGQPDPNYVVPGSGNNASYIEPSSWFQYQLFADFEWRPTDQLTITPGIKFLNYRRTVDNALESNGALGYYTVNGSRDYEKPLYFFTANYRVTHNWSVYAQAATALLIPPIKTVVTFHGTTDTTAPEQTTTYQVGTVYAAGPVTFDLDYYNIQASNILDGTNANKSPCFCYINLGSGVYSGVEAEGAYTFGRGFTVFANGSVNDAKLTRPSRGPIPNSPKGTAAVGVLYDQGPWMASIADKFVGPQVGSDGVTNLAGYNTVDATVSYDFGRFKLKLAAFNLADSRAQIDFDGTYEVFQVGRQIQATIEAKFP
ncbi:MAG TPA: TonB-dependent receptor [Caulobacteraceae bacterium]|nr:TonB-dependent receptor [Caulobacteraceae bacterium]